MMRRTHYVLASLCVFAIAGCMIGDDPTLDVAPNRATGGATLTFGPEAIWAGSNVIIGGCGFPKGSKSNPTTITLSATGAGTFSLTSGVDGNGCLVDNLGRSPASLVGGAGSYTVTASVASNAGKSTQLASGSFTAITPPSSACQVQVTARASLPAAISYSNLVAVGGKIYSFGGAQDNSYYTASAFRYDPATDTWATIASLPAALEYPGSTTDGTYAYIAGAKDRWAGTTVYRYDPVTDTYTELATSTPLPDWAAQAGATVEYLNGNVYYFGGAPAEWYCTGYPHLGIYHIATNTWTDGADYPDGDYTCLTSGVVSGGAIYAGGGAGLLGGTASNKTFRYDPAANTWADATVADLPMQRASAGSALVGGQWMLVGGDTNQSVITWDPATNRWALSGSFASTWGSGSTALGSTFYALGGVTAGVTALSALSCK